VENKNTPTKQTTKTVIINLIIKVFRNPESNIAIFLISIIGPNTKNPRIPPTGNTEAMVLATTASEEEQRDKTKAITIKNRMDKTRELPDPEAIMAGRNCWNSAEIKIPVRRYFPTLKNSFWAWRII
jgi:hypothetical protein